MRINHIRIQNFRKLKNCRIDFDEDQIILVGANNSGKTSAISAMVWFLTKDGYRRFSTREFTATNWRQINDIGDIWLACDSSTEEPYRIEQWENLVPALDVWFDVKEEETYLVSHIIPSLLWNGDNVGFRVRYEPKNPEDLYRDYREAAKRAEDLANTEEYRRANIQEKIFPKNLLDFLNHNNNVSKYFTFKYYVLDNANLAESSDDVQTTPTTDIPYPAEELICIDSIMAYREFTDPDGTRSNDIDTLSKQLQEYYRMSGKATEDIVESSDLELMGRIIQANKSYDDKLHKSLEHPIQELSEINYPGFQNPSISIKSQINVEEAISHESAVQFAIQGNDDLSLPEKYNGLGYRNLISIYFRMIQFRENWIKPMKTEGKSIARIHLVFIEEPEAHLHAQAQQVFIRKALESLTGDNCIQSDPSLTTQLVISTHSNHIVNELDIKSLKYFRRHIDPDTKIPVSTVVNLSGLFGNDEDTRKFVTRYIRLTHCDIFFADAAILVEGAAERILMPRFLQIEGMNTNYIAIIEVNGNHAHRFYSLIKTLGLPSLVVTDIDATSDRSQAIPERGKGYKTGNSSIKKITSKDSIDDLLDLSATSKIDANIRVAYQTQINVDGNSEAQGPIYPYTFEDALIFSNIQLFRDSNMNKTGTIATICKDCAAAESIFDFQKRIICHLNNNKISKAEFANSILYEDSFDHLRVPEYISEGLKWLKHYLTQ